MKRCTVLAAVMAAGVGLSGTPDAQAAVTIGGLTFDDNAFADTLIHSRGFFSTAYGLPLDQVLTDKDPVTWALSFSEGATVKLGFTDNVVVNGSGPDLALFELHTPSYFVVGIDFPTQLYPSAPTGQKVLYEGVLYDLNVALVDLSDLGIASGEGIPWITIGVDVLNLESVSKHLRYEPVGLDGRAAS